MQLDKTRIAVRERSVVDTMDLSLQIVRRYAWPLLIAMSLGVLPLALLNHLLLGWMLHFDADVIRSGEMVGQVPRYVWTMMVLVVIEAPLASVFTTTCLGQAMFLEQLDFHAVIRNVFQLSGRILWSQLFLRGVLPALMLTFAIDRQASFDDADFLLAILFLLVCLRRAVRPFLNEIVLLEHLPYQAEDTSTMTIAKRNVMLHRSGGVELLYRWLVTAFFAALLTVGIFAALVSLQGVFLDVWMPGTRTLQFGLPAAMWLVAGFIAAVRFLNYLDLRIRQEGWEVELRMRAEATRLFGAWQ